MCIEQNEIQMQALSHLMVVQTSLNLSLGTQTSAIRAHPHASLVSGEEVRSFRWNHNLGKQ